MIKSQNIFYQNVYLILTFDLVTLTLGQLHHLIDISYVCKYNQSLTSHS